MNQRERFLVIVICAMGGLALLFGGLQKVSGMFRARQTQITALERELSKAKLEIRRGQQATEQMNAWERQALPGDDEAASSLYKKWLSDWVDRNQLIDPKVKVDTPRSNRGFYTMHPFTVTGRTDLRRLTAMLHEFYTADQLHRIRGLTISPVSEKALDIYMTVDALALPAAGGREPISTDQQRLAQLGPLEQFQEPIFERNLFGPENNTPRLSVRSSYEIERGQRFSLDADASDRDEADRLTFNADLEELPGARFSGGKLEWTPRELGEYYAVIEVADDGIPSRIDRKEVKFEVVEPAPPPPPRPEPKPPVFDFAAYTQFNAVIVKDDVPTAWLWVRPTDEMLRVKQGETFKIGELEARMVEIGLDEAIYESEGRRYQMALRDFVGKARDIGEAVSTAAAETTPTDAPAGGGRDEAPGDSPLEPPLEEFDAS